MAPRHPSPTYVLFIAVFSARPMCIDVTLTNQARFSTTRHGTADVCSLGSGVFVFNPYAAVIHACLQLHVHTYEVCINGNVIAEGSLMQIKLFYIRCYGGCCCCSRLASMACNRWCGPTGKYSRGEAIAPHRQNQYRTLGHASSSALSRNVDCAGPSPHLVR